jgi:hypothetical protein
MGAQSNKPEKHVRPMVEWHLFTATANTPTFITTHVMIESFHEYVEAAGANLHC